jgi:hypothetical protein
MFIGPLVILLGGFGIYATDTLAQKYINYKSQKAKIEKTYERLNNPKKGDYYLFCGNNCYTLKIDSLINDSILFSAPVINKSNTSYVNYDEDYIDDNINHTTKKVWIEKSLIKKAYGAENSFSQKFKGVTIKQLNFIISGNCKMTRIQRRLYNSTNGYDDLD